MWSAASPPPRRRLAPRRPPMPEAAAGADGVGRAEQALVAAMAAAGVIGFAAVHGTRRWRPALGAVPLSIAVVAVASFDPGTGVRVAQTVEALLVLAYL